MKFKIGSKLKFSIFQSFGIVMFFSVMLWTNMILSGAFVPIIPSEKAIFYYLFGENSFDEIIKFCGAILLLILTNLLFEQQQNYQKLMKYNEKLISIIGSSADSQKALWIKMDATNGANKILIEKIRKLLIHNIDCGNREEYSEELIEENDDSTPISCLECKYYTDNDYLKCAVHPDLEINCPDFEAGEQIENRYYGEDEHESEDEEEVIGEIDWIIDHDYLAAAVEDNPDSKLISCLCGYPLFVSLGKYQFDDYKCLSWTYFTCSLNDNNREINECPNCYSSLI